MAHLAARQQPPIADVRIRDREAGDPRAFSVPFCRDSAALAVFDPAQRNGLDVTGNVDANNRFASELGRSLEDVDVRTVVMRLVEERPGDVDRRAHPLTAPWVSPSTM